MTNVHLVADDAAGPAGEMLTNLKQKLGGVPNILRAMANSPSVLQGYLDLSKAASSTTLDGALREKIALAVSEVNNCHYCLSAHTTFAKKLNVNEPDILSARRGESSDPKTEAILVFCQIVAQKKGWVDADELASLRAAGVTEEELVEIILVIALNIFTNYFNHIVDTDIDFPKAPDLS
jgi:uncharacterized peroxidase-related enzyme